ncbi:MAG: efflux RND transporter periplasmic adaptor subunit [Acidobacteria bacterium]|nr:efflux RND transporter periplasmic adaptor subunit [Acidobacteriota bacterium]
MTRRRKIVLGSGAVLVLALVVGISVRRSRAGIVEVQMGPVSRQDLASIVTASGEVRPRHYVNINSQSFGKIIAIEVAEGDVVRRGQVLLRMEAVQPAAEVEAQRALVRSGEAAVEAAQASQRTAQAEVARARADFERAKLEWERGQQLFGAGLVPQSEYDARRSAFDGAQAAVDLAAARVRQAEAEFDRARSQLQQARATQTRVEDVLQKTIYTSPINGIVTNLPVHVGEQMVPGIQNSPGSFLMTVADMSEVTAEVKVDETDIVNVRLGHAAEVTVDAYPNRTFQGKVTEIGTTAIVRSTGQSTAQLTTGTQEAKDFKVVVTLTDPPENVRPGLSTTARVTTATREKVLAIPIQALTIRRKGDIQAAENASKKGKAEAADRLAADPADKEELQGVFVVKDGQASFRPVKTGITGVTDIEVTEGLEPGEQIVTGSYKVLRELKHLARVRKEKEAQKTGS